MYDRPEQAAHYHTFSIFISDPVVVWLQSKESKPTLKLCFVTEVTCQSDADIFQLLEPLFRKVRIVLHVLAV
jgi:hypothetical protein